MPSADLAVCVATEVEGALIRARLGGRRGEIGGKTIDLIVTGIGPVNAAWAVARHPARGLMVCGVGGAYPGSTLEVGDVVCAATERYADLGVEGQWDMEALGFEVAPGRFNELPLSLFPAERRAPFVTSATCTATDERAAELEARTGGAVESMEGAAVVHVALLEDKPVGEIRGISNRAGKRDRSAWRVKDAARAAQERLLAWLES